MLASDTNATEARKKLVRDSAEQKRRQLAEKKQP